MSALQAARTKTNVMGKKKKTQKLNISTFLVLHGLLVTL